MKPVAGAWRLTGGWSLVAGGRCLASGTCSWKEDNTMNINKMINSIKAHPDFDKAGMILCHNGVVRATSRDGRKVSGLRVSVDHEKLDRIISQQKQSPGITDIQVEISENIDLEVGDDVMLLAVAGDIRENVIAVLTETLNSIKSTVTDKTEYYL